MFKIGDEVMCINSKFFTNITENNFYIVINIAPIVGTILIKTDSGVENWFMVNRFILDIKYKRKQKLNNICSK